MVAKFLKMYWMKITWNINEEAISVNCTLHILTTGLPNPTTVLQTYYKN
jgi:hypothetical protein